MWEKYKMENPHQSLLVALAGLVCLDLACSVSDSPFEELAESDQSSLGVIHGLEDGFASLCSAIRRGQAECAWHCRCPLDELVELSIVDLTTATGISLNKGGQQELVQAGVLPGVLVCHCGLNGREELCLGIIGNVVEVNLGRRVDCGNLAGNVGGGPIGELRGTNPTARCALLAVHCVKHGLACGSAFLNRAAVLCFPRWSVTKSAGHGG